MYLLLLSSITTFLLSNILVESIWLYMFSLTLAIVFTNMLESNASSLFAKVVPSDYNIGMFNSGNSNKST